MKLLILRSALYCCLGQPKASGWDWLCAASEQPVEKTPPSQTYCSTAEGSTETHPTAATNSEVPFNKHYQLLHTSHYTAGSGLMWVFIRFQPSVSSVHRERQPGQMVTWTGPGFARVKDGAGLEFAVSNIPYAMEYDIMIRYEPEVCCVKYFWTWLHENVGY